MEAPSTDSDPRRADPGTGKTFTLVARCLAFADTPSDPSGAELHEGRRRRDPTTGGRSRGAGRGVDHRRVRRTDPAAGRPRIRGLVRRDSAVARRSSRTSPNSWSVPEHVLVDEVQDLVGPRLDFVLALLRACIGGLLTVRRSPTGDLHVREATDQNVFEVIERDVPWRRSQGLDGDPSRQGRPAAGPTATPTGPRCCGTRQPMTSVRQARACLAELEGEHGPADPDEWRGARHERRTGRSEARPTTTRQGATARLPPSWLTSFASADPRTPGPESKCRR